MGIILSGSFGCTLSANESNLQVSKSIAESKKDGFFFREYKTDQSPSNLLDIVEVWEEKVWYNKVINPFKKTKILSPNNDSWIVIKVKEKLNSKYAYENYSIKWQLSDISNMTYSVGYVGGLLVASLKESKASPLPLQLILKENKKQVGIITLIPKDQ